MVKKPLAAYQRQSLALLGFKADRLVEVAQTPLQVEKLILSHAAQRSGVPHAVHLANIRHKMVQATSIPEIKHTGRRLYVSRSKANRKIVNEAELEPVLQDYGFEFILNEDLSFADQIRLFASAQVVLGAHGAGIYNHIFCPPGATIIEIYNRQRWEHAAHRIANMLGHHHWHVYGDSVGQAWETSLKPEKLKKVLAYALNTKTAKTCAETAAPIYDDPY